MVRNLIACELAYINTNHPDFISGSRAVAEAVSQKKKKKTVDQNETSDGKEPERSPSVDPEKFLEREQIETEIISTFSSCLGFAHKTLQRFLLRVISTS
jgi:hypothetical protein